MEEGRKGFQVGYSQHKLKDRFGGAREERRGRGDPSATGKLIESSGEERLEPYTP